MESRSNQKTTHQSREIGLGAAPITRNSELRRTMKTCLAFTILMALSLTACSRQSALPMEPEASSGQVPDMIQDAILQEAESTSAEHDVPSTTIPDTIPIGETGKESTKMNLRIGDTPVEVQWEDNESVEALRELAAKEPLTISLSMYGGFEQVGAIGQRLPRDDVQTTTSAGDIVLYSGNQIVVFYGSNSWAYTRLGHITDQDAAGMKALLGNGDVSITISVEDAK